MYASPQGKSRSEVCPSATTYAKCWGALPTPKHREKLDGLAEPIGKPYAQRYTIYTQRKDGQIRGYFHFVEKLSTQFPTLGKYLLGRRGPPYRPKGKGVWPPVCLRPASSHFGHLGFHSPEGRGFFLPLQSTLLRGVPGKYPIEWQRVRSTSPHSKTPYSGSAGKIIA